MCVSEWIVFFSLVYGLERKINTVEGEGGSVVDERCCLF